MIQFFGKPDRQRDTGKIASEYPAWFFDNQINLLKEEIEAKKRLIENPAVDNTVKFNTERALEKDKARLKEIEGSKPKLRAGDKDKIAKLRKVLGEQITDLTPTESNARRGTDVNIFDETQKMIGPCVKVDSDMAELVQSMGANISEGMISRNQATKCWQIASKLLDEDTNSERLQRDTSDSIRKFEKTLIELFKEYGLKK